MSIEYAAHGWRTVLALAAVVLLLVGLSMITGLWDMAMISLRNWVSSFGTIL